MQRLQPIINTSKMKLLQLYSKNLCKKNADKMVLPNLFPCLLIKRPARDACLCMGELLAPPAPPAPAAPHFVFLITL